MDADPHQDSSSGGSSAPPNLPSQSIAQGRPSAATKPKPHIIPKHDGAHKEDNELLEFKDLIFKEFKGLHPGDWPKDAELDPATRDANFQTAEPGAGDEPWVVFTKRDHFGLALSGGGIRSATFNLGLLQGLNRGGVLEQVDYLATVSGGGYIGGFWTAWRHSPEGNPNSLCFPPQPIPTTDAEKEKHKMPEVREPGSFRHLREFSRFLMPRLGALQAETWSGIVTILAGMAPSSLATSALVTLAVYLWFFANYVLVKNPYAGAVLLFIATMAIQYFCEKSWIAAGKGGPDAAKPSLFNPWAFAAALVTGVAWLVWRHCPATEAAGDWLKEGLSDWPGELPDGDAKTYTFSVLWFGPAVAWFCGAAFLGFARFIRARFDQERTATPTIGLIDRCTYRCLAPSIFWAVLVLGWEFSRYLHSWKHPSFIAGGGTLTLSALFFWFRDWLNTRVEETQGTRLVRRLVIVLKPAVPQLLAWGAVISFVILVTFLVQAVGLSSVGLALAVCAVALVQTFLTLWLFDPGRVGLHEFYRARIARCYLGAARVPDPDQNRATAEQLADDPLFRNLTGDSGVSSRPIHLVCCTGNNIGGDVLSGLYRGARSVVLSANGISLGNFTCALKDLRLSAALTASAAAFNSQMGRLSMRLGSAVAMLMSALDLRLGLWVPHPLNPERAQYTFPGRFFLFEMFGHTRCEPLSRKETGEIQAELAKVPKPTAAQARKKYKSWHLHLSDGGHFENLALYELVRRHCRYIIVSDCGADPEIVFDDLAIALRTVREDFGVEIELDVSKLRPGPDRRSAQHAVVGTIHYNGLEGTDKGTILYFKPTLTGDEPPDVLQYQARNSSFPHQSTGEQFYDEAQWEAYRRLGEHEARIVLGFPEKSGTKSPNFVENLFLEAGENWAPTPARLPEIFLELTQRCAALEATVRDRAPASLRREFFPEMVDAGVVPAATRPGDESRVIYFVMLAAQQMEDTWIAAELDVYWSHPLNQGWMRYFQRWASTPSFRRWWPILRSTYSKGFGDFVKDRFDIRIRDVKGCGDPDGPGAKLDLDPLTPATEAGMVGIRKGLAWRSWTERYDKPDEANRRVLEYKLSLEAGPNQPQLKTAVKAIQVGFLLYKESDGGPRPRKICEWQSPHLYVPHALIGGGILGRFLDAVINHFKSDGAVGELRVIFEEQMPGAPDAGGKLRPDAASRFERVHTLNFYKSRGFVYQPPDRNGELRALVLDLDKLRQTGRRAAAAASASGAPGHV